MTLETCRKSTRMAAIATVLMGVAALGMPRIPSADTWWHLAAGRLLVESRQWALEDPFSFGPGRGDWLNHEWLAEILFYLLHQAAGLDGVFMLRTLIVVLAFAILPMWAARRAGASIPGAGAAILGCAAAAEGWAFFDARAYLFTYLGLAGTLFLASEALRREDWRLLLPLPGVTVLWANCHGGFILGPLLLFVAALGCLLPPRSPRLAWGFVLVGAGTLALCAVATPFGPEILGFPFSLIHRSAFTLGLNEWARPDLSRQPAFLALMAVAFLLGRRTGWPQRLWLAAFLSAGLLAWRHAPLGALVSAFVLPASWPGSAFGRSRWGVWLAFVAWTLAVPLSASFLHERFVGGASEWTMLRTHFPVAAADFLRANPGLPRDLYNPYEWGGYLEWTVWPKHRVFIDGRANTVYSQKRYAEALAVQFGEPWGRSLQRAGLGGLLADSGDWEEILDRHGIRLAVCTRLQGDLVDRMSRSSRWFEVYRDPLAVVYLRAEPGLRRLAQGLVHPDSQWTLFERAQQSLRDGQEPEALERVSQALNLDPNWPQALVLRGIMRLRAGLEAQGEGDLRAALARDPAVPEAHFNLAVLAWNRGERARAIRELRHELSVNPTHAPARSLLEELLAR